VTPEQGGTKQERTEQRGTEQPPAKHNNIRWNPATQEWFCVSCGVTSDHDHERDARVELEQYECNMPWVEMPVPSHDNQGNR
jgi:hypothetical protein